MLDDFTKALRELSKYEVRRATGHGAGRSRAFGIFLKETSIRCATFAPVGMGLMRALDVIVQGKHSRPAPSPAQVAKQAARSEKLMDRAELKRAKNAAKVRAWRAKKAEAANDQASPAAA